MLHKRRDKGKDTPRMWIKEGTSYRQSQRCIGSSQSNMGSHPSSSASPMDSGSTWLRPYRSSPSAMKVCNGGSVRNRGWSDELRTQWYAIWQCQGDRAEESRGHLGAPR